MTLEPQQEPQTDPAADATPQQTDPTEVDAASSPESASDAPESSTPVDEATGAVDDAATGEAADGEAEAAIIPGSDDTAIGPADDGEAGAAAEEGASTLDGAAEAGLEVTEKSLGAIEGWIEAILPIYRDWPLLQVITIVFLSLVAAGLVNIFLKRVLGRWFDRTKTDLDDNILAALTTPIYVSMIAVGSRIAIGRVLSDQAQVEWFAHLLQTLALVVWLIAAFQISGLVLTFLANQRERFRVVRPSTLPLFDNLSKVAIFLVAVYLTLQIWDKDVSGLLAAGGIAGIAVGFAARDTLANLFAGIFIFADRPYKIGDFINLDSGERGEVTEIGIRSTRLLTRDDVEVTIPNSVMGSAKIVNESGGPHLKFRIRVKIGVAYGSDMDHVERVLLDIADSHQLVCKEPSPRVRFRVFGASSLDLELLVWVDEPVLRGKALHELNTEVYKRFNAEGIEIPYAKSDVYIKEMPQS